ncbi:MAG: peptidyl-prolyl cis-trans isomerase [Candidatus Thiodiazotropha lotti]|nr:peptidyl-prolyl cis-trans isomerase [Candidatus Thiodiazotropha lotti]
MKNRCYSFGLIAPLCGLLLLSGCSRDEVASDESADAHQETVSKDTESVALAYVNGSPITEQETQHAMQKLFADRLPQVDGEQVKQRILESLISSRAISLLAQQELDAEALQQLDIKVMAYREELLVQEYLSRHVTPEPVSGDMVSDYYDDHPEEFGGGVSKRFEMVQTYREIDEDQRKVVIGKLSELAGEADWDRWLAENSSLPVNLRQLTARVEVLDQPLKALVSSADVGETSPLHIDEVITVVRVNDIERHPPKPLAEVSAEIRKRLAPIKMRAAIKQLAEDALQKVEVDIVADRPDNSG